MWLPTRIEQLGFRAYYRFVDLTYAFGIATPKRTVAGTYRSYEPTNPHGDDPGLVALDRLPEDATILDVGAHVGEHAIPLALGNDRHVVAFEPSPVSADRLARNAAENGLSDRLDLRRIGVGDERATVTFYRSTFSKCSAFDRERATRWGAQVAGTENVRSAGSTTFSNATETTETMETTETTASPETTLRTCSRRRRRSRSMSRVTNWPCFAARNGRYDGVARCS